MDDSKEPVSFKHNKPAAHRNLEDVAACTVHTQVQVRWGTSIEKRTCKWPPLLNRKLSAIDTCWQRKHRFSPTKSHWLYQPYFRVGPRPQSKWPIYYKLNGFLQTFASVCVCGGYWSFACVFQFLILCLCAFFGVLLLIVAVCFVCFLRREKGCGIGYEREREDLVVVGQEKITHTHIRNFSN